MRDDVFGLPRLCCCSGRPRWTCSIGASHLLSDFIWTAAAAGLTCAASCQFFLFFSFRLKAHNIKQFPSPPTNHKPFVSATSRALMKTSVCIAAAVATKLCTSANRIRNQIPFLTLRCCDYCKRPRVTTWCVGPKIQRALIEDCNSWSGGGSCCAMLELLELFQLGYKDKLLEENKKLTGLMIAYSYIKSKI